MTEFILTSPVCDLDNRELLPAGTVVSEKVLSELISKNMSDFPNLFLLEQGSIRQEIRQFMLHPPYDVVFADKEHTQKALALMETVQVIPPVLESLEFFKEKDFHTYRHMLMVFALSTYFGSILIPGFEKGVGGIAAGPTHDFGKINVPIDILTKREALTREEYAILHHHTSAGFCLLSYYLKDPNHIAALVAGDHHERQNGSGYPRGIKNIHPLVEIVVVCDVYDALLSPRPYRPKSYDNRSAVEIITEMAEKGEIGWEIVKLLVSMNRVDKPNFRNLEISLEKRGSEPEGNMYGKIADS